MRLGRIATQYIVWHYRSAWLDLWRLYKNFLWFVWNFFSISFLLETLLDPFQRLHESYSAGSEIVNDFFSALIVNTLMRVVGFVVRGMVIVLGLFALAGEIVLGALVFLVWALLPGVFVLLLGAGGMLLF